MKLRDEKRKLYAMGTSTLGRRRVTAYDARQLRVMLLADHRRNRADSVYWMVAAVTRIADKERREVERVWRDLNAEAQAETGRGFSPFFA